SHCTGAWRACREYRCDQRKRRWSNNGGADALKRTGPNQPNLRFCSAHHNGGATDKDQTDHENSASAQQIAYSCTQSQETTTYSRKCSLCLIHTVFIKPNFSTDLW